MDMAKSSIKITLPKNRRNYGVLQVWKGPALQQEMQCMGRADTFLSAKAGNPTRDPLKVDGDTPTGEYSGETGKAPAPAHSYGPTAVIRLTPVSGQAKLAADGGKRSGLLIHGGDLGLADALRPTEGCVRVSNEGMAEIIGIIGLGWKGPVTITESNGPITNH